MRAGNDDDVHRFQGKWIDLRGTMMPAHFRYVTWLVFVMLLVAATTLLVLLPFVSVGDGATWGFVVAVLGTILVMNEVDGDRTLRGFAEIQAHEIGEWVAERRRVALAARNAQPVRYSTRHVRVRQDPRQGAA